jgi:hypothetical protein
LIEGFVERGINGPLGIKVNLPTRFGVDNVKLLPPICLVFFVGRNMWTGEETHT